MPKPITVLLAALWFIVSAVAGEAETVEGRVRLLSGRGARAEIHAFSLDEAGGACPALRAGGWDNLLVGANPGAPAVETRVVHTEPDGTFRLDGLEGPHGIYIDADGFAPHWLTAAAGDFVEVVPREGTSVHVLIDEDQPPLAGLNGRLIPLDVCGVALEALGSRVVPEPWAEASAFHWDGVPPGVYALRLAAEGRETGVSREIVVEEEPIYLRWVPVEGRALEGRVVRSDGGALDAVTVTARWGHREEAAWASARADADGHWRLAGLPVLGTARLDAAVPGVVRTAEETGYGLWNAPSEEGLVLTLDTPVSVADASRREADDPRVAYRVTDGDGLPVRSFELHSNGSRSLFAYGETGEVAIVQPGSRPRRISHPGEAIGASVRPQAPDNPGEPATVTLANRVAVHGSVVDGYEKEPLAGVMLQPESPARALVPVAASGRDGDWALPWSPPEALRLRAVLAGYADAKFLVAAGERGPHRVEMLRPAGIDVQVRGLAEGETLDFSLRGPDFSPMARTEMKESLGNGERRLEGLTPGRYALVLWDELGQRASRELVLVPGEHRTVVFDFDEIVKLSGRASMGEKPLVDQELHFRHGPLEEIRFRETSTDDRGNYEIGLAAAGRYEVRVKDATGSPTVIEVGERARQTLDLRFGGGSLLGRVLDEDATPLSTAGVSLGCRMDSVTEHLFRVGGWPVCGHTRTDPHGSFELTGLEAGSYRLRATDGEHVPYESETFELEEGRRTVLPDIVLERSGPLFLRVRDADGFPLVEARLVAAPAGELFGSMRIVRGSTGEHGLAKLVGLKRGRHDLAILPVGGPATILERVSLEADDEERPHDITLGRGAHLHAIVRDTAGTPLPDVRVSLFDAHGNDLYWVLGYARVHPRPLTDGAGRADLGRLAAGRYSVGIVGAEYREPVELIAGGTHEIELTAP